MDPENWITVPNAWRDAAGRVVESSEEWSVREVMFRLKDLICIHIYNDWVELIIGRTVIIKTISLTRERFEQLRSELGA